jgi:hypothetical protein
LIRKFTDGKYYLFDNYIPGVEPTNIIDVANTRVATLSANLVTNVITLRGLDPLDYSNTKLSLSGGTVTGNITVNSVITNNSIYSPVIYSSGGTTNLTLSDIGIVSITSNGQEFKFGASGIETNKGIFGGSFGGNRISLDNETNVISNRYDIVKIQTGTTGNVSNEWSFSNNRLIFPDTTIQNTAWTGADVYARNTANLAYDAANTAVTTGQANVGNAIIAVTSAYQANVGAGLITKVDKAGDVMTGALSTSGAIIGSSLTANTIATINTNAVYESTAVTTAAATQFTLDSFSTTAYRSAKYLVQISSGSSYELLEMTLIHDGTTVYLSQYGNIKTGATLGVFDATISTGTLSLLATPNNAVTTFKTAITLIPV